MQFSGLLRVIDLCFGGSPSAACRLQMKAHLAILDFTRIKVENLLLGVSHRLFCFLFVGTCSHRLVARAFRPGAERTCCCVARHTRMAAMLDDPS
jgi:hypothetical protein